MAKMDIRLKYDDAIDNDISDYVINFIKELNIIKKNIKICFWYIDSFDYNNVKRQFEMAGLSIDSYNITFMCLHSPEILTWYDIIHENDVNNFSKYKFRATYSNQMQFVSCLMQFKNMLIHSMNSRLVTIKK